MSDAVYVRALEDARTVRTVWIEEMTGIQALERVSPDLPMRPGKLERHEFEYRRHGTQTLIADLRCGRRNGPEHGRRQPHRGRFRPPSSTASSARSRLKCAGASSATTSTPTCPEALCASSPVIAASTTTSAKKARAASVNPWPLGRPVLCDKSHTISFHFTSKHASWLNQIEIWFSIVVRKLFRRASFRSRANLKASIETFITYFNETMAKPFKWTMTGKPLTA